MAAMRISHVACLLTALSLSAPLTFSTAAAQATHPPHAAFLQAADAAPQQFADLGDVKLESGQVIHNCRLGYRTVGTLNAAKSNAVLFPTWFTGHSSDIVEETGPGKVINSSKYFVVIIDALGDGVSCSPSNSRAQHGTQFPAFSIRDMVDAEHRLATETLHLDHVHAVMGISMGGMQTFQWMVSYPDFMDRAIPIVGTPQQSAYDVMLWQSEATAIEADPAWHGGSYTTNPRLPVVALVHDMNLTTPKYRVEHTSRADSEHYFETVRDKGIGDFDANDWLWQLKAMLKQDVAQGGSLADAAQKVKTKVLVISARQDHMVDPIPALEFADLLHADKLVLESDCGHASPGCEADKVSAAVEKFLAEP
jgi:homoserine O-acetyltransferase